MKIIPTFSFIIGILTQFGVRAEDRCLERALAFSAALAHPSITPLAPSHSARVPLPLSLPPLLLSSRFLPLFSPSHFLSPFAPLPSCTSCLSLFFSSANFFSTSFLALHSFRVTSLSLLSRFLSFLLSSPSLPLLPFPSLLFLSPCSLLPRPSAASDPPPSALAARVAGGALSVWVTCGRNSAATMAGSRGGEEISDWSPRRHLYSYGRPNGLYRRREK